MSKKQRIKVICANADCKQRFRVFAEPKGVLVVHCLFCDTEQKIDFEEKDEHNIYRSFLV